MTGSDWVAIIAAAGTAVTGTIAAYGAVQSKRTHVLVNSRTDIMLRRQAQLEAAMRKAGMDVPPDPAVN